MPTSEQDLRTLLYFVALQAVRISQQRDNIDATLQEIFRMMTLQVTAHRYDEIRKQVAQTDPGHADLPKDELTGLSADTDSQIDDTIYMKNHMIRHLNWLTVMQCDRFVFAGKESITVETRDRQQIPIHEVWSRNSHNTSSRVGEKRTRNNHLTQR